MSLWFLLAIAQAQNTLTVPDPYPTLEAALGSASPGDIVEIDASAVWSRNPARDELVNMPLTIRGVNGRPLLPRIRVTGGDGPVTVTFENVEIRGVNRVYDGVGEDVGAVFWDRQMAIIEAHVEDARAKGANILMGGRRNPDLTGLYYEPTVITEVDNTMDIMVLETFGPVLCIQKVENEQEALALANDSEFGLNGNVWTRDKDKGYRMAAAIDTGSCSVNDMAMSYGIPAAPFGGKKNSGVGQVNGKKGIRGYCHEMPIVIDRFGGKMQNGYPYSAKSAEGMKKLMEFLWVKTPLGKWLS